MNLKDFLYKTFVKFGETKPQVSDNVFKTVVGVSKNDFEKKLRNVDSNIKVLRANKKHSNRDIINSLNAEEEVPHKKSALKTLLNDLVSKKVANDDDPGFYSYDVYKFILLNSEAQSHLFTTDALTLRLNCSHSEIDDILKRIDDEWLAIYSQLLELRQEFKILINIDRKVIELLNIIFRSSPLKILEFEYLDLVSSLKDDEEINLPDFNFLHFSLLTSNYNDKTGFA